MEIYDRDDAFFKTVNDHRTMVDLDASTKAKIEQNFPFIEKAIKNSIEMDDMEIKYHREVEKSNERLKKLISALLITATLLVPTTIIAGNAVSDHMKINNAMEVYQDDIKRSLVFGDYAYYGVTMVDEYNKAYNFTLSENSTEKYSLISGDSVDYIYNMKQVLSEKEFNKFIRSRIYINPETNKEESYINFFHYLSVNGFKNEREFNKAAEKVLLEKYEKGDFRVNYNNVYVDSISFAGRGGL